VRAMRGRDVSVTALTRGPAPWLCADRTAALDLAAPDLRPDALNAILDGADTVVHLAGANEVDAAAHPDEALAATVEGAQRIADAAVASGVRRLVYVSTVHVYGARMVDGAVLTEDLRPEPRAPYAIARLACEHVFGALGAKGVDVVCFRLTNAVGAPAHESVDRWTLVANDLCRQGVTTGRLVLQTSGTQYRDFVALNDVASIIADAATDATLAPGIYNLASGRALSILELAGVVQSAFAAATGCRPPIEAPAAQGAPPRPYHVSTDRLAAAGLRAGSPIEDAVRETVEFCLQQEGRS
jgi:UDP-glucose 4-epimerase